MKLRPLVLRKVETNHYKCFCGKVCIATIKYVESTELNSFRHYVWHIKYNLPNMKSEQYFSWEDAKRGLHLSIKVFIFNFISE